MSKRVIWSIEARADIRALDRDTAPKPRLNCSKL